MKKFIILGCALFVMSIATYALKPLAVQSNIYKETLVTTEAVYSEEEEALRCVKKREVDGNTEKISCWLCNCKDLEF